MDVMMPEVFWIGRRCYRRNPNTDIDVPHVGSMCEEDDVAAAVELDTVVGEEDIVDFVIEQSKDGQYKTTVQTPSAYFKFIIGAKGATRRRLELETKTTIRIPRQGQEGDIIISGGTRKGVISARLRMELLINSAREKQQFTHFLSISLTDCAEKFIEFKNHVLETCGQNRGMDDSLFQIPEKLHLTIGTLVLLDNNERKRAAEVLEECQKTVIEPILSDNSLTIAMRGIEYMNDDPAEVDVLYGKVESVDGSEVLHQLANCLVEAFIQRGMMIPQYDRVKLHVTLMNTLFRQDKFGVTEISRSRTGRPRESFDARKILQDFGEFNFGKCKVSAVHLSQRYSTSCTGYYSSSALIQL